jgi:hypothetical protein
MLHGIFQAIWLITFLDQFAQSCVIRIKLEQSYKALKLCKHRVSICHRDHERSPKQPTPRVFPLFLLHVSDIKAGFKVKISTYIQTVNSLARCVC